MLYRAREKEKKFTRFLRKIAIQFKFKSFEYIDITAKCSGRCSRIVTIYRPPPPNANRLSSVLFVEEFSTLAEQLAVAPGNLLIVGDYNFYVNNSGNTDAI